MIGIFYGSTTGNTEAVAKDIATALGVAATDVHDVGATGADAVVHYDLLLFGSSTWGYGDLQDDWYDFLDDLKAQDLTDKRIAFFGCGDSDCYPDTFCAAISLIHDAIAESGATFIGQLEAVGGGMDSPTCRNGQFLGLTVDDANESATPERLAAWLEAVKA